jgi:valyl-tRNA synthetase
VESQVSRLQALVRAIRNLRSQYNVPERAEVEVVVRCSAAVAKELEPVRAFLGLLARVGRIALGPDQTRPPQSAIAVHSDFEAYVSLQGLIDVEAEVRRLARQKAEKERLLQGVRSKLANPAFVAKAPAEIVEQQRAQEAELLQQLDVIARNLQELAGA